MRIDQEERKGRTRKNNYNYELMAIIQARYDGNLDHHGSSGETKWDSTCISKVDLADLLVSLR